MDFIIASEAGAHRMTAVLEMKKQPKKLGMLQEHASHNQDDDGCGDRRKSLDDQFIEIEKNDYVTELDKGITAKEVKIDIEAKSIVEKSEKNTQVPYPSKASATSIPTAEEFSNEKDAPEVSTRVYDFNMVKQKTLPRISFGNNSVFQTLSSHSKSYILLWTLMPISIVICIIVLIVYFT